MTENIVLKWWWSIGPTSFSFILFYVFPASFLLPSSWNHKITIMAFNMADHYETIDSWTCTFSPSDFHFHYVIGTFLAICLDTPSEGSDMGHMCL
jgi:hypothetical protein